MPERSWVPGSRVELHGLMISSPIERRATGLCANACCYIPLPRIGYTATWYHDEMLAGQGHNLNRLGFRYDRSTMSSRAKQLAPLSPPSSGRRGSRRTRAWSWRWNAVSKNHTCRYLRGRFVVGTVHGNRADGIPQWLFLPALHFLHLRERFLVVPKLGNHPLPCFFSNSLIAASHSARSFSGMRC